MTESDISDFQGVGVVSCSPKTSPEAVVKKIIPNFFDSDLIHSWTFEDQSFMCYPWHLSNKYFEADINFVMIPSQDQLITNNFSSKIHALIIYIDIDDNVG